MFAAGILPITISVVIAAIPHLAVKLGVEVHPFLVAPVFTLWVIFTGIVATGCIFFRQFVLAAFIAFASFMALLFVYIWYVI